jgi:hypothetical protein
MTPHLITVTTICAVVIAAGIYLESMRRHARATKIAERERRKAQERRMASDRRETPERRQAERRHRSRRHRSRGRHG